MEMNEIDRDDELQRFFDAARRQPNLASDALMERVLGDALSYQTATEKVVKVDSKVGFLAGLWAGIGGWPAAAGLATASLAGLWIGVSPSLGLADAVITTFGSNTAESYIEEFSTSFDFAFYDGELG